MRESIVQFILQIRKIVYTGFIGVAWGLQHSVGYMDDKLGQLHPRRCSLVYHSHPCFFSPCPQLRYRPINALFSLHSQTIFRPRIGRSSVASITSSYHVLFSTPVALFLCCKMALLHSYAMETWVYKYMFEL